MSRNTKIVLGVVAGVLVLCMAVSVLGVVALAAAGRQVYRGGPEHIVSVGRTVTDPALVERAPLQYSMPSGWRQDVTLHVLNFDMIGLSGSDGHSHIFLVQLPASQDAESAMRDALAGATESRTNYNNGMALRRVGQSEVTLRGQKVTMTLSEGTNHDGETYRQMAGVALDESGQTAVLIEQPVKSWDQAMVDAFLASVR